MMTTPISLSQVWPWKATNVDPLGHLETESDFVNRAAKMRKTKIKLALEWFKGARAEEEEQEEEEDDRDERGDDDDEDEEGKKKKKRGKESKKRKKERIVVKVDQNSRTFACPFCDEHIQHKFVSVNGRKVG